VNGPDGQGLSLAPGGPVVLAARVGAASGSRAAAAALACAASEPDRAALLIDLADERAPRSTLVATAGARELEERLVAHLPEAGVASRGGICRLRLSPDPEGIDCIVAALPLVREAVAVIHAPPTCLRPVLDHPRIQPGTALLRADLPEARALTALTVQDLMAKGLRVGVLKHPLGRLAARAALLGVLPPGSQAIPSRLRERLLSTEDKTFPKCYAGKDGSKGERQEASRRELPR
jgi:hypothetical protein